MIIMFKSIAKFIDWQRLFDKIENGVKLTESKYN
jgi:hypothetical protein